MAAAPDPNTAFAMALWAGLVEAGVARVCVCPGSRSAPLAVTAAWQSGLEVSVHLDERSAGFFALGASRAERRPVALVCTSGTAAANFLPAVVEAHHAGGPLIVFTADRPPEVRGWGAAQTIDQCGLYGTCVRWFAETPPPGGDAPGPAYAAALAARCVAEASGPPAGPVHVNVPFREPLQPNAAALAVAKTAPTVPTVRAPSAVQRLAPEGLAELAERVRATRRGMVLAGPCPDADPRLFGEALLAFSRATGWPVLAEVPSQLRFGPHTDAGFVLAAGEALLRNTRFASTASPDCVLRLGTPATSKAVQAWLAAHAEAEVMAVAAEPLFDDPAWRIDHWVSADPCALLHALARQAGPAEPASSAWLRTFQSADKAAGAALARVVDGASGLPAARVVRELGRALPTGAGLFLSNSMALRYADLFLPIGRASVRVFANRGANGIDGIVSSALGASLGSQPMALLTGDLAFLHDLSGLVSARRLGLPLVVVVLDDDGGGIFDHLPIAALGERVEFERLFRTPHGLDIGALVGGIGVAFANATTPEMLRSALQAALASGGPTVIRVPLDPAEQLALQQRALAAVDDALREEGVA